MLDKFLLLNLSQIVIVLLSVVLNITGKLKGWPDAFVGKLFVTLETASLTSLAASSTFTPISNSILIVDLPSTLDDDIVLIPWVPPTVSSISWVICESTISAEAPV